MPQQLFQLVHWVLCPCVVLSTDEVWGELPYKSYNIINYQYIMHKEIKDQGHHCAPYTAILLCLLQIIALKCVCFCVLILFIQAQTRRVTVNGYLLYKHVHFVFSHWSLMECNLFQNVPVFLLFVICMFSFNIGTSVCVCVSVQVQTVCVCVCFQ